MRLKIVTPTRILVDAEVDELVAPGSAGEMGILPEHVNFLGQLDLGVLRYTERGQAKTIVVHGGYAEVSGNEVTVLADDAEFSEEIAAAEAKSALANAESDLSAAVDSVEEIDRLLRARRLAEARVSVAR